ncbi:MAG: AAA family ATPase, partial [Bryobacteraceae bacterium]|nr:AAA family ATPase [Bryobacteraceae bacterium]
MKHFCTAGPVKADLHYMIPPLERIDLDAVLTLIDQQKYFVLHAPRQTGKTSCLLALAAELNRLGRYRALYFNVEGAQAARDNQTEAIRSILSVLANEAEVRLGDSFPDRMRDEALLRSGPNDALREVLFRWSAQSPLPICLLIDEIDALVGDSLITVLRQLRAGYAGRPSHFPQSVILCGVRDVRDYRIHGTKEIITGGSAFNIKA